MDKLKFKEKRLELGYTQVQLGKLLGLNSDQISRLENGHHRIKKSHMLAINAIPANHG